MPAPHRPSGIRLLALAVAGALVSACAGDPPGIADPPTDPPEADSLTLTWLPVGQLPEGLDGLAVARGLLGVYLAGGETEGGVLRDHFRLLDAEDGAWHELAPLPRPLRNAHLVFFGEALYLAGGVGEEEGRRVVTDGLHRYDVAADRWETVGRTPAPMYGGAAGVMDGRVTVVGPLHDLEGNGTPDVRGYAPALDEWRTLAPPDHPRMGSSGSSVQGDLFMAGGKDPATGQPVQRAELRHNFVWHPQGTTPQPRIGVAGAPVFFEPYLVGGVDDEGVPVEPYALRFETDLSRWTTVRTPPIDVPVRGHQVEFWTTDAFLIVGGRRADGSLSRDVLRVTVPRPGAPPG